MNDFMAWFEQYWLYAVGLVIVCVAAFFVFRAAARSYKRYYSRYREQEAEIKRLLALKEKYQTLTKQVIFDAPDGELLEGAALSYQLALQKEDDISEAFSLFSKEKQFVYALDVFTQDKSVRTFFKENGRELTEIIVPALEAIGMSEEAHRAEKIRIMFDETDETTSISENEIEQTEAFFETNDVLTKIKLNAAEYIRKNAESLTL